MKCYVSNSKDNVQMDFDDKSGKTREQMGVEVYDSQVSELEIPIEVVYSSTHYNHV